MSRITVAKFGGTSMADANQIRKVAAIVKADPRRKYIVVSAPGKRSADDMKVTDLLYGLHRGLPNLSKIQILEMVRERFASICTDLKISAIDKYLTPKFLHRYLAADMDIDNTITLGEFLSARILAEVLDYTFVDASHCMCFDFDGKFDMEATQRAFEPVAFSDKANGFVIPGFYGSLPSGKIKTFARGGSDYTGAVVAACVRAAVYENWTDVSGLLMADPTIVPDARRIETISYKELRELTYMGARVLHDEVVFPLKKAEIPIHIKNTNRPNDPGTVIGPEPGLRTTPTDGSIVGIAGRKDFTVFTIEKALMNQEVGFVRRVCEVFEKHNVSIEHLPGGIDTLSVVVKNEHIAGVFDLIRREVHSTCVPDVTYTSGVALICVVGNSMAYAPGTAARIFMALAAHTINVRMIDQGSSERSIIVGVENRDYERAVRAIYAAFQAR